MTVLYSLNEFNLASFLIRAIMGRPVFVLSIDPVVPSLGDAMNRLITGLARRGWVKRAVAEFPALVRYEEGYAEICFAHLYPRHEREIAAYLRFDRVELGEYETIFKHAAFTRVMRHLVKFSQLEGAISDLEGGRVQLKGIPYDFCDLYAVVYGRPLNIAREAGRASRRTFNAFLSLVVVATAILRTAVTIRLGTTKGRRVALGADFAQEGRVRNFFMQIVEDPDEILFVLRNRKIRDTLAPDRLTRYRHVSLNEGRFTPRQAISAAKLAIQDTAVLFRKLSWLPPHVFFAVAKQIDKRIQFRAFFDRFPMAGFLARDEYNTDHITRTQELRRAGILSLGISHGMATGPGVYPHNRYLDYDIFYVFGAEQHRRYAATWPKRMTVKPVGGYSLDRTQIARLGIKRTRDIVIFANQVTDPPAHVRITAEIARAFPDRAVFVKLKYDRDKVGGDVFDGYLRALGDLPPNVKVVCMPPYELLMSAGYAISGLSTVVAEAVQMGLASFFVDVYRADQDIFFRAFPELCVSSAPDAIDRIRRIENGEWTYPRNRFADLVDLSGRIVFDQIRADLALPPFAAGAGTRAA